MKILITLLLAFMFVSNVYAEDYSSSVILGEGKIISVYHEFSVRGFKMITYEVYYKEKIFRCNSSDVDVMCFALIDSKSKELK